MHSICKFFTALLIALIMCSQSIYIYAADDVAGLQSKTNEISEQISITNNQLKVVKDEMSEEMQQIQNLDVEIAKSQEEIENIDVQVEELENQIQEIEKKLKVIQKEYEKLEDLLDNRVIDLYETPKLKYIEMILTSESITEMLSKYFNIEELIKYDSELLQKVNVQKEEIEKNQQILNEKKQELNITKENQNKKNQVLSNTKIMKEYYLSKLNEEEQKLQKQIDEYNLQVYLIESEIKSLSIEKISADYFGGPMTWPVPGYTKLTSLYGMRVHPITGAYKLHTGIDISAPMGTNFVAAAKGIVTKATYNTAYGNMVIIDHGGGVQTLYAHGSEILVEIGQEIEKGTEILKVGSTGYSTGPHAHFEIRINGLTVNPLEYLNLN